MSQSVRIAFLLLSIFSFIRCSAKPDNNPQNTAEPTAATIAVVSGNNQSGHGGFALDEPIIIRVTDLNENPIPDVAIEFDVVEGGGTIPEGTSAISDADGQASVHWTIESGYNGLEVRISDESYQAPSRYVYATGENPTGLHITRTIASLRRIEINLYTMRFYGDYSNDLAGQRSSVSSAGRQTPFPSEPFHCSLFSVFGDPNNYLLGRNFDNPSGWRCLTLVTQSDPSFGYASLTPVRLRDIGFGPTTDFDKMPFVQKRQLIRAIDYCPDGLNEHGLVMGLANVTPQSYAPDPNKESISCTEWVRKVLDYAKTVDEAAEITNRYNIANSGPPNLSTLDVHAIVADSSGRSIILEPADGEMKVIPNTGPWQVMTNIPVYNVPLDMLISGCWRYDRIYAKLLLQNGILSRDDSMALLSEIANIWTEWSAVYDIARKRIFLALDFNYDPVYEFRLDDE
jgi:hypothetical protein